MNVFRKTGLILFLVCGFHFACGQQPAWIATWGASAEAADRDPDEPLLNISNQTVRERARVSIGGRQLRIQLSNEFGPAPVVVGRIRVGLANGPASVVPGSVRPVTFGGLASIRIPPGAPMLSDPVDLPTRSGTEISVSLYFPERLASVTWHSLALKEAFISTPGDHTGDVTIEGGTTSRSSVFLSNVLIASPTKRKVIVALGDSIVDGDGGSGDKDGSWPSDLVRRLETRSGSQVAVVNEGIAGNRLLHDGPIASLGVSALARFDRDALSLPGVTTIILFEGLNDIGFPGATLGDLSLDSASNAPAAEELIGAYRQLIARAHARGVRVIGCTMTPFEGVTIPGYHSGEKERMRQTINQWIRAGGAFDGVVDFDAVLRDPTHPSRMLPRFASEDQLHPNEDGYEAMANAINPSLVK